MLDAAGYWERMRIAYNIVLASISMVCWAPEMLSGRAVDFFAGLIVLSFFAVPANLFYCAAYPVDFVFQLTHLKAYKQLCRWMCYWVARSSASACALWVLLGDHMGRLPKLALPTNARANIG